jgi:hypothetical protein
MTSGIGARVRRVGPGNVFRGNSPTFPSRIDGDGFRIQGANRVACDNSMRGAASGLANIACT